MFMVAEKKYKVGEKPLNVVIDNKVADAFNQQHRARGQIKKQAGETAIRLWLALPAEVQAKLIQKDQPDVIRTIIEAVFNDSVTQILGNTHSDAEEERRRNNNQKNGSISA